MLSSVYKKARVQNFDPFQFFPIRVKNYKLNLLFRSYPADIMAGGIEFGLDFNYLNFK